MSSDDSRNTTTSTHPDSETQNANNSYETFLSWMEGNEVELESKSETDDNSDQ